MSVPRSMITRSLGYAGLAKGMWDVSRASDETVKHNAQRHLAERMGKLHGLPQKIGQMLSLSEKDDLPGAFSKLTDAADPLPFDVIERVLAAQWGAPVDSVVSEIDPWGHAASLGQVHRAALHDGREVAIKVAYPGIRDAVMADLKVLGWLSAPVGDLRRGFNMPDYRSEILRDLNDELDYRTELRNQLRFRALASVMDGLIVPEPIADRSTDQVLVSVWEDGCTIEEAVSWPAPARAQLGRLLLNHFLTCVFDHGLIHGDPHPGNYRFRLSPDESVSIVLYDYGSVASIDQLDRMLLLRLVDASNTRKGDPMSLLVALGFNPDLLSPIRQKLPAVCSVLFEPFGYTHKFDLGGWNRAHRLDDILGDDRWNFRMAGPAKLIFLMRAFRGLLYYLERLQEPVSWGLMVKPLLERHAADMRNIDLAEDVAGEGGFEALARHLRIEVHRNGTKKVSLTLPSGAVEDLDAVIDADLAERIRAQGTDIKAIVRDVRRRGYAPMELFALDEPNGERRVRVWIE